MFYDEPDEGHKPNNKVGLYTTVVADACHSSDV